MHKDNQSDLVWGAEEIGLLIGRSTRQAFALLEGNHIPCRKVGGRWVASRNELLNFFKGSGADAGAA
ncbi:hypothetical protein ATY77_26705 [Rhizobium sp. R634]|uniref:hypothetical protein n=1 Tax=Rhizobium sp. R634 TaxID=1764274 RepID=UPI000B536C33|nr:hypothetical protein [Rhizobium sp. R634]OWV79581.1 hypothetical protein ATY77_26705 [Rhizobium sp. R634]